MRALWGWGEPEPSEGSRGGGGGWLITSDGNWVGRVGDFSHKALRELLIHLKLKA